MLARSVASLIAMVAVVALAFAAGGSAPGNDVVAAAGTTDPGPTEGAPGPTDGAPASEFRRIVQGQVLAVRDAGRQLEAAIDLQWAPKVMPVDEQARFAITPDTRIVPAQPGSASLRPGEPVQVVAVSEDGETWRATEITKLDLD